jgi:small subunit ribosomal protein S6
MNSYELVFILKEDKDDILNKIRQIILDLKGEIISEEKWGKKNFAYLIKRISSGYYFLWRLNVTKDKILELKKKLDFEEDIIRYLLLVEQHK